MPYMCVVPGCRGNYKNGPKVSVFRFPIDDDMKLKWIHAIRRKDFVPNKSSRVCEKHFVENDIIKENSFFDKNGEKVTVPCSQYRLKAEAVPAIFPNCPKYLSKPHPFRENPDEKKKRIHCERLNAATQQSLKSKEEEEKRRSDRLPSKYSKVCSCHFKDSLKIKGPTIFDRKRNKMHNFESPEKKRQRNSASGETVTENDVQCDLPKKNLQSFRIARLNRENCMLKKEIGRLKNEIIKLLNQPFSYSAEEIKDLVNQCTESSEKDDNILKIKTDQQQNSAVRLNNELTAANIIQSYLQSSAENRKELLTVKVELDEAYTEIYTLKKEKEKILEQFESMAVRYGAILDSASKTGKELENVKKELQQAYEEINALRGEKNELKKKVSSSNITDSILQDAAKLHFYTGLNSVKDFQSVLTLIYDVDFSVKCIPMVTQLLIVLMKLKLNLLHSDLAYRFQISNVTVRKLYERMIPSLEAKLESLVKCPINNALKKNIPHCYKNTVYENLYSRLKNNSKSKTKQIENEDTNEETVYSSS